MRPADPIMQESARRLLEHEASKLSDDSDFSDVKVVIHTCEKMSLYLSKLVGVVGFQALLVRALTLAKEEVNWLEAIHIRPDATLEGFEETALQQPSGEATQGGVALLTRLLELLVIFIGQTLTMRLVTDVWPEVELDDLNLSAEGTPQ